MSNSYPVTDLTGGVHTGLPSGPTLTPMTVREVPELARRLHATLRAAAVDDYDLHADLDRVIGRARARQDGQFLDMAPGLNDVLQVLRAEWLAGAARQSSGAFGGPRRPFEIAACVLEEFTTPSAAYLDPDATADVRDVLALLDTFSRTGEPARWTARVRPLVAMCATRSALNSALLGEIAFLVAAAESAMQASDAPSADGFTSRARKLGASVRARRLAPKPQSATAPHAVPTTAPAPVIPLEVGRGTDVSVAIIGAVSGSAPDAFELGQLRRAIEQVGYTSDARGQVLGVLRHAATDARCAADQCAADLDATRGLRFAAFAAAIDKVVADAERLAAAPCPTKRGAR